MDRQKDKVLLVEGNDDKHVLLSLRQKFGIPTNFDIEDCKGVEMLLARIPVELKVSGTRAIGIIIDADADMPNRWVQLSSILTKVGCKPPEQLPNNGLVANIGGITIGVWIMPDNAASGMLEDFIAFLVPERDPLFVIANDTLDTIEQRAINNYRPIHRSKALIHTWLAWQEQPGTSLGQAITRKYLSTDHERCQSFVDWLLRVFA